MKNIMTYKGYYATIQYSDNDKIFFGEIENLPRSSISFEGNNVEELRKDFEEAIDGYLSTCKKLGLEPEKQYKGSFNVRIEPDLHKKAVQFSKVFNMSLNQFIEKAIREEIEKCEKNT